MVSRIYMTHHLLFLFTSVDKKKDVITFNFRPIYLRYIFSFCSRYKERFRYQIVKTGRALTNESGLHSSARSEMQL